MLDRKLVAVQNINTTKVQLGELIQIIYRNLSEMLVQEQKQLKYRHFTKSPPQHGWQLMKAGNQKCIVQSSGSLSVLSRRFIDLSLFRAALPVCFFKVVHLV